MNLHVFFFIYNIRKELEKYIWNASIITVM